MPIPTPHEGEEQDAFINRCMGNPTMNEDFPDQEQRSAVCFRQWREAHGETASDGTTAACWSMHVNGIWAMETSEMDRLVGAWHDGGGPALRAAIQMRYPQPGHTPLWGTQVTAAVRERRTYELQDHTAMIPLAGPMTKGDSKFGGTSTVRTRHMLRQAVRDPEVHHIVLQVYSPGGHVDGVQDLADEVFRIRGQKPIVAHIEDLGASAAYWVASQADRITANGTAEVGSIGTMAILEDSSKRLERLGITVHVIATGPYKGLGVEGAPVSAEALGYVRQRVEAINAHFLQSIQRGRGLTADGMALVSDGRVHHAAPAARLGLLDAVQDLETTLEDLRRGGARALPRMAVAAQDGWQTRARARSVEQRQRLKQKHLALIRWETT